MFDYFQIIIFTQAGQVVVFALIPESPAQRARY
jgi:hypothetical protein